MIKGLRGATIWSEDLNHLLPFYRDVLGFRVGLETEGFVVLGDPATPTLALGTHSEVRGRNLDPTDYGTLRIATLRDPEGNLLQLLQPLG